MNQTQQTIRASCPVCAEVVETVVAVPPWAAGEAFVTERCERCSETFDVVVTEGKKQ